MNLASGRSDTAHPAGLESYRRESWDAYATWTSQLGDTTISLWRDQKQGVTPGVASGTDQLVHISHTRRLGGWRLGLEGMQGTSHLTGATGQSDSTLSGGFLVDYASRAGPQVRLRLGRDRMALRLNDDSYVAIQDAFALTASLDLSRYLRKRFRRDDLTLYFEYRKRVEESLELRDRGDIFLEEHSPDGFVISYSMLL